VSGHPPSQAPRDNLWLREAPPADPGGRHDRGGGPWIGRQVRTRDALRKPDRPGADGRAYPLALVSAALVLVTLSEGVLLGVVPSTVTGIGHVLHVSPGSLNWIISVQLLATGVCTPVFSRLGDIRGHRRILRVAALLTAAGGVLMAVAPNFPLLLAGRVLQGPAGAFTALAIGILRERAAASRLRRGIAAVVTGASVGAALGALAAAELYRATGSVRDVLWIPAACSAGAAAAAFVAVPETRWRARLRTDWLGAASLSGGLAVLLLALASGAGWGWASGRTIGALTASAVLLGAWAAIEWRVPDPLIDLRVMTRRAVAPFYLASLPIGVAFFGATTATNTFLAASHKASGYGFGLDVTAVAYVGLANASAVTLGAMVVPRLVRRVGHKPAIYSGCAAMLAGYAAMAAWHGALWPVVVASAVSSLGLGLVASAMAVALTERADPASTGVSVGLYITVRAIGGSVAGAGFAALLTRVTIAGTDIPRERAYVAVWLICGLASLLSLLIVAAGRREPPAEHRVR
jgi:MFS family permease